MLRYSISNAPTEVAHLPAGSSGKSGRLGDIDKFYIYVYVLIVRIYLRFRSS